MQPSTRVQWVRRLSVALVALTFALMVVGSWVKATGSGLACPDWPKCYGEWLPPFPSSDNGGTWDGEPVGYPQQQILYEWGHRLLASIVAPVLLALAILCLRGPELPKSLRVLPSVAGLVLLIQIGIGGLTVVQGNPAATTTLHLATATLFFFLATWTCALAYLRPLAPATGAHAFGAAPGGAPGARAWGAGTFSARPGAAAAGPPGAAAATLPGAPLGAPAEPRRFSARLADYVEISKPRIILLLLIVAWAAMFVASRGFPPLGAFVAVTLAGTFSTAASGAFNNVIEIERDRRMGRTAHRPLAAGRIRPRSAVVYGAIMAALSVGALLAIGAWLAAALTATAIAYYVLVYTVWLKPTTPQNIVIGGLAGSFPAFIGWAAVTGSLDWPAFVIAGLVFLWTPAHFWALALLYKRDYAAADYPMLPNIVGEHATRRLILVYSALTVLASLALVYPLADGGIVYLAATIVFGLALVVRAGRLETHPNPRAYRGFFLYTIQYLGFVLVALMVDQVLFRPLV